MPGHTKASKRYNFRSIPYILFAILLLIFPTMAESLLKSGRSPKPVKYRPPDYEQNVQKGVPDNLNNVEYFQISTDIYDFMLGKSFNRLDDGSVDVYFTNPEWNEALLLLEILGDGDTVLYQSGLLRPGEYLANLKPLESIPEDEIPITINIYGFVVDMYHSLGTYTIESVLYP